MKDNLEGINKKLVRSSYQFEKLVKPILAQQSPIVLPKRNHRKNTEKSYDENPEQTYNQISNPQYALAHEKPTKMPPMLQPEQKFEKTQRKFYTPQKQKSTCVCQLPSTTKFSVEGHLYNQEQSRVSHHPRKNTRVSFSNSQTKKIEHPTKVSDISHQKILQHIHNTHKLNASSKPQQIFDYFNNFIPYLRKPLIKKFKNCLFFGDPISKNRSFNHKLLNSENKYQGFLYFYNNKMYYGDFVDENKHGSGVEINLNTDTVYRGTFDRGHKVGKFQVFKNGQKFEGYLNKGKYHGQGRLQTDISVFTGAFYNGQRHGKGQQYFYKSGLKLAGDFFQNKFSNVNRSNPSFPNAQAAQSHAKKKFKFEKPPKKLPKLHHPFQFSYHDSSESEEQQFKPSLRILNLLRRNQSSMFDMRKQQEEEDSPLPSPFKRFGLIHNDN